jgi:hypothetical protein
LGSLLSRTPISPSDRLATSTQLLLEKLRELLIQHESEPGPPGRPPSVSLLTSLPRCLSCDYDLEPRTALLAALGAASAVLFVVHERRAQAGLVDLSWSGTAT